MALVTALAWAVVGRALRGFSHLRENPRDLAIAPLMALVVAVIALPIKVWAALTMNRQGWLTRTAASRVQGQREITVPARPPSPPSPRPSPPRCVMPTDPAKPTPTGAAPTRIQRVRSALSARRLVVGLLSCSSCPQGSAQPR